MTNTGHCHINESLVSYGIAPAATITLYSIAGICGVTGNLLILLVLFTRRIHWFANDIYYLNMIFTDFLVFITLPAWVYYLLNYTQLSHYACIALSFVFYVSIFIQADFMVAVAIERYRSLVKNKPLSVKKASVSCACIWIIVIVVSSPYYMFRSQHETNSCILGNYTWHMNSPFRTTMDASINIWSFVVPAVTTLLIARRIYVCTSGNKKMNARASGLLEAMVISMLFFGGLFNLNIFRDIVADTSEDNKDCTYLKQEHFIRMVGVALVYGRAIFNPFMYMCVSKRLRQEIKCLFMRIPYETLDAEHAKLMVNLKTRNADVPDPKPREYESVL
ncbi:Ja216 [Japanese cytomegalovirus]|nr:Ja216 [Japanese cytomegalovirus]